MLRKLHGPKKQFLNNGLNGLNAPLVVLARMDYLDKKHDNANALKGSTQTALVTLFLASNTPQT